jgi:hypothetical protein
MLRAHHEAVRDLLGPFHDAPASVRDGHHLLGM